MEQMMINELKMSFYGEDQGTDLKNVLLLTVH